LCELSYKYRINEYFCFYHFSLEIVANQKNLRTLSDLVIKKVEMEYLEIIFNEHYDLFDENSPFCDLLRAMLYEKRWPNFIKFSIFIKFYQWKASFLIGNPGAKILAQALENNAEITQLILSIFLLLEYCVL